MVDKDKVQQVFDAAKSGSKDAQQKVLQMAEDSEHPNHEEAAEATRHMGDATGP